MSIGRILWNSLIVLGTLVYVIPVARTASTDHVEFPV